MQDHKKLIVYHDANRLVLELERDLARVPRGFGELKRQLLDAAWSVPANIAEGCGASTNPEFARFLDNSIKSLKELEHHVLAAYKRKLFHRERFDEHDESITLLRKRLFSLVAKVRKRARDLKQSRGDDENTPDHNPES